jgi:hypothetical protein
MVVVITLVATVAEKRASTVFLLLSLGVLFLLPVC